MGDSPDGDRFAPSSSSDELSAFLRQILSRTPTTQPSSPPNRIIYSGETLPSFPGGFVSPVGDIGHQDINAFENKRNGGRQRNTLKRNIDAQFHNLSEKRRRSKINEKMKALQKLIPNSNKTDKASMLDEAIEYLKQLQLQVQTLAVMNGLGLNPMQLPPILPPTHIRINETSEQNLNLETLLAPSLLAPSLLAPSLLAPSQSWNHLK